MKQQNIDSPWLDEYLEKDLINYFFFHYKEKPIEAEFILIKDVQGEEICEEILQRLLNWIMETSDQINCSFKVKQRTIIMINTFVSRERISANQLQLLGVTALFIATKLEDRKELTFNNLIYLSANQYTPTQILEMEWKILKLLKFNLNFPIPGEISRFLFSECVSNISENIFEQIDEFITYSLTIWELSQYPFQIIAVSCVLQFLFCTKNEEVMTFLTKFILQNKLIQIKTLEEFNSNFYPLISEDETILALTKNYFLNVEHEMAKKISTPSQNKNALEEEKSTMDTVLQNKYFCESPSLKQQAELAHVNINSFLEEPDKLNEIIEENSRMEAIEFCNNGKLDEVIFDLLHQKINEQ